MIPSSLCLDEVGRQDHRSLSSGRISKLQKFSRTLFLKSLPTSTHVRRSPTLPVPPPSNAIQNSHHMNSSRAHLHTRRKILQTLRPQNFKQRTTPLRILLRTSHLNKIKNRLNLQRPASTSLLGCTNFVSSEIAASSTRSVTCNRSTPFPDYMRLVTYQ